MTLITSQATALKGLSVSLYETSDPSHPYAVRVKNADGRSLALSKHENADEAQEEYRSIVKLYGGAA